MTSHSIKAIIFDFDGLIMDTELPEFRAWEEIFTEYGQTLTIKEWANVIGASYATFDPFDHLVELTGNGLDREAILDRETITERRTRRHSQLISDLDALPGVLDYIAQARQQGIELAIASSSPRYWVEDHLRKLDVYDRFSVVVTREDALVTKPEPDLFIAAVRALGIEPDRVIAIEDSPNGIAAARKTGLFTLAVPNTLTEQMDLSAANHLTPSLTDLPLGDLLTRATEHYRTM